MAPLLTSTILRASHNFELGTSESKDSLGPRPSSRETFLGPGDAERVRFPTQRYVRLGRCFRKAFGPKKYHTHLLYPLLRTAVRALTNVITPRLGLRSQHWWPGLGVVGGFVIGIGMAGPGLGALA